MSTPVGIIKKFVKTLVETNKTGTEATDAAFKAVGAGNYTAFKSEFLSAKRNYKSAQDFCEQECGIRINNKDTGAITGKDAGGKTEKTAESIMPEAATAKELKAAEYKSFTKNGLTVNIEYEDGYGGKLYGKYFDYDEETYLAKQKLVVRALYNWWIPEALDLINESLGINFTDGRANTTTLNIEFDSGMSSAIKLDFDYDMGYASEMTLKIDADLLYNMTKNDKNGTLPKNSDIQSDSSNSMSFTNYLDRLILQAMAEVTLKANVAYVDKLPREISGGLCAIVGGYDDSTNYSSFTSSNGAGDSQGYARLRYLAKNYSDGIPDGVSYNAKKATLTLSTDYAESTLDLADFASTVKTVKASVLKSDIIIVGNKLDNSILGGSGNDSISGGDGKDSLNGGKGNDSLTGGKGNDVFIYTAGNDVITDYAAGDKIFVGSAISKATLSGSDVVFTIGKNTLTVKKGKDKTLTLINSKNRCSQTLKQSVNMRTGVHKRLSKV